MHSPSIYVAVVVALLLSSSRVNTEALQGCAAVHCPNVSPQFLDISCRVQDTNNKLIGLAMEQNPIDPSAGDFTWTVAVAFHPNYDGGDGQVERSFYLGTPPDLDLQNAPYIGCSLYFDRPDHGGFVLAPQSGAQQYVTAETCGWGLGDYSGDQCIADLQSAALQLTENVTSSQNAADVCSAVAASLAQSAPDSCSRLLQDDVFPYTVHAVPLTGNSSPRPIAATNNASSNCWPTLPKSNQLTPLYGYNFTTADWVLSVFSYTPVMSIFFQPGNNSTTVNLERSTSFQCLKPVDSDDASQATRTDGSNTSSSSSSSGSGHTGSASRVGQIDGFTARMAVMSAFVAVVFSLCL